jgi:hypothetical protein
MISKHAKIIFLSNPILLAFISMIQDEGYAIFSHTFFGTSNNEFY